VMGTSTNGKTLGHIVRVVVRGTAQADARAIIADNGPVLREGLEEVAESRLSPVPFQVRDPPRRTYQQWPRPVGGVRDSGAPFEAAEAYDGVSHGSY
jgi:hypothetical protein